MAEHRRVQRKNASLAAAVAATLSASAPGALHAQAAPETELRAVTVTSTRTERPVHDAPATVSVIDAAQMDEELARDITDLVRYEPGVSVGDNAGRFGPNSFNIRGIGGNRVLMQVDGIRLPDAFSFGSFSSASRNVVDIDALKAVEILRGPGSSLYGSDAIAGVVSYITKDPSDYMSLTDKAVFASLKGGYASADDSWLTTATLAGGRGDLQGMLVATYRTGHETENKGTVGGTGSSRTEPNPQSYDDANFLGKLVFRLDANNRFKLTAEHFRDETSTNVLTLNPQTPTTSTLTGDDQSRRDRISLEQEHRNPGGGLFQIARWQVYLQESETSQQTHEQRANAAFSGFTGHCSGTTAGANTCDYSRSFDYRQRVAGFNAQLEKLFDAGSWAHRLVYGLDLSRTRTSELRDGVVSIVPLGITTKSITPDAFPLRDFPESDTTQSGLFVQDEIRHGKWSVIPGLRYDYYRLEPKPDAIFTADNPGITPVEKKEDAASPRLGLLFRATPRYTVFGQYAHGFRAPPYNDVNLGFTNFAFGYTAVPNPDLKPERSRGAEIGLRGDFGARGRFSLAAFHNRYRDFISSQEQLDCPGDPACSPLVPFTFQSRNIANVRISGFEARGEAALGAGFGLIGALSYAEGEDTDTKQPVNSVDPLKLVTGLRYDAPAKRWGGELVGTFVAKKDGGDIDQTSTPVPLAIPSYSVLDLIGYWNLSKRTELRFGVFNLTDEKYYLWSDVQGAGGGTAALPTAASIDRFSQPGRNLRITLKYQL
jgi:hemoglobin/transferrin/lactoferrin receptor protein